ncbi:hypothetical protein BJV82DRAFT_596022 [Fennellomyces sp. T-0311]|nr:hypothetical protein BJV82DRAFT_596022 [Fennellomyces sp. T-0311]
MYSSRLLLFSRGRRKVASFFILLFIIAVYGEYDVTEEQLARIPHRFGAASFQFNGVLYSYGGATRNSTASNLFTSITFDENYGRVEYSDVPQSNSTPGAAHSEAVILPDNNRVILFGGRNLTDSSDDLLNNTRMRLYEYRFDTRNWTALPIQVSNGESLYPRNRKDFSATLAPNGQIYIHGGLDFQDSPSPVNDSWVYNPETNVFTRLPPVPGQPFSDLYGHSAVPLPNGVIVYIMGNGYYGDSFRNSALNGTLCDLALLLNTHTNEWTHQQLSGQPPQQIIDGYAVLGPDRQTIYMSGGYGASRMLPDISVSSNDLNALNTTAWVWTSLEQTIGEPPKPRFYATAELLHDLYMVVAFGVSEYFWYNDINVLRFYTAPNGSLTAEWTTNLNIPPISQDIPFSNNYSLSNEIKMAIAVGALAALVATLAYISWYYRDSAKEMLGRSYRCLIWTSRVGEPMWTGLAHIISKFLLSCMFLAYLVYTIYLVVNSSTATLTIQQPVKRVMLPDIRFCFDGWQNPSIGCQTETLSIDDCVDLNYTQRLDMGMHQPYFGYTGTVNCFLFHADEEFRLSASPVGPVGTFYNGSRIQFSFYGDAIDLNNPGLIHVTLYPRGRDPNLSYYFNETQYGDDDDTNLDDWLHDESNNLVSENTYIMAANKSSAVSYQLSTHRYLQNSAWNLVGISYAYNDTPSINTLSLQGTRSLSPLPFNINGTSFLDVYPQSYLELTMQDERVNTILASVGPVGGLLTLLITLNTCIFGSRPRSPWGLIHRMMWTDRSRNSLLDGLYEKFGNVTPCGNIPFINPVEKRFLTSEEADCHDIVMNPVNQPQSVTTARASQDSVAAAYRRNPRSEKGNYVSYEEPLLVEAMRKIDQLQRRVQLTELLLKAYYIDEEVFRNLHIALSQPHRMRDVEVSSTLSTSAPDYDDGDKSLSPPQSPFLPPNLDAKPLPADRQQSQASMDSQASTSRDPRLSSEIRSQQAYSTPFCM